MLLALAAIWGASFLFIKVAVRELSPATLITGRLGLAALTLALLVPFAVGTRETLRQLHESWAWLVVVALVNTAIPFWLLSWGETRIDSGLASIHPGERADLQRADRLRCLPRSAGDRRTAAGCRGRFRRRGTARRRAAGGQGAGR